MINKYVIPVSEPDYDVLLVMLGLLSNIILFDKAKLQICIYWKFSQQQLCMKIVMVDLLCLD